MSQGYIMMAIDDSDKVKNIVNAYALSLSIKLLDPERETCVVVHKFEHVPKKYEHAFDYIVELPFGRSDINHHNMYIDFWQLYHCTPFDETIFVNTYSLAVENIDGLWEQTENIVFGQAHDFRNEQAATFGDGVIYFRKEKDSSDFFQMCDPVFKGWRDIYREYLENTELTDFDFPTMLETVIRMVGDYYEYNMHYRDITYDILELEEDDWMERLNIWFTADLKMKVNNHRQCGFVKYSDPDFLRKDFIDKIDANYQKAAAAA